MTNLKKSNKIPAICVPNVNDPVLLEKSLDHSIGSSNYNIRISKFGDSRIYAANSDAFRAAVKTQKSLNFQFWHHQIKEDKVYIVLLKGIHSYVPKSQTELGFIDKGFEVIHINCPKKKRRTFRLTKIITKLK